MTRNVPERTAERILVAVEQEQALASAASPGIPPWKRWMIAVAIFVVFGCLSVYIALEMAPDKRLHLKYLIPVFLGVLLLSPVIYSRLFGWPINLPRPPEPPG